MGYDLEIEGKELDNNEKQGRVCCGCCCDMRRAVIILNIISIVSFVIDMSVIIALNNAVEEDSKEGEDLKEMEQALKGVTILAVLGWLFNIASVWGAIRFNHIPLALNAGFMVLNYVVTGILETQAAKEHNQIKFGPLQWAIGGIIIGLTVYAHAMPVMEIRSGIMSRETYQTREKMSCCCV